MKNTENSFWDPARMILWRGQMADLLGLEVLTQASAAALLDVSRRQLINWEKGRAPINLRVALACNFLRQNAPTLISAAEATGEPAEHEGGLDRLLHALGDTSLVQDVVYDRIEGDDEEKSSAATDAAVPAETEWTAA